MLKRKVIIIVLSMLASNIGLAQTISLACTSAMTEEWLVGFSKSNEELCSKFAGDYCRWRNEDLEKVQACRESKLSYTHKRTYVFDKSSLNSTGSIFAETTNETCWGLNQTSRTKMITTTSNIAFETDGDFFNVDRETLRAGWGTERRWVCNFNEIKKKNKL